MSVDQVVAIVLLLAMSIVVAIVQWNTGRWL